MEDSAVSTATSAVSTATTATDDTARGQWGVLYDALQQAGVQLPTGPNSQFQFIPTPMVAAFSDSNGLYWGDFYGNYASADMGPSFNRSVEAVSDGYYDFINSLEYPDPSTDPEYQKLLAQQKNLVSQLSSAGTDATGAYKAWVANGGATTMPEIKTLSDWLASPLTGGSQYQSTIASLNAQIANVNQQLMPFLSGSDAAIVQAVKNAAPSNMVSVSIPQSGGLTKMVYSESLSPELAPLLAQWIAGQKSNFVQVTLTKNTSYSGHWHIEGGGSTDFFDDFFGFFGEGETTYDKTVESDSHFKSTLEVQALSTFAVVRNGWFDGALLTQFPNGPWAGRTADQYFGSQGSLKLVPAQLLVAYGVSLALTLSSETMTSVKTQTEAAGGILIGPFFFGAEAVSTSEVTTNADGSQTINVNSTDNNPYVIGVLSTSFYNGD
jgi:hypothetical protein